MNISCTGTCISVILVSEVECDLCIYKKDLIKIIVGCREQFIFHDDRNSYKI